MNHFVENLLSAGEEDMFVGYLNESRDWLVCAANSIPVSNIHEYDKSYVPCEYLTYREKESSDKWCIKFCFPLLYNIHMKAQEGCVRRMRILF